METKTTQVVAGLDASDFAVIDMDTGTVLGTNLKLVSMKNLSEEELEEISSSDSAAWDYAYRTGAPLLVETDSVE